jgi:oxygen-dependent protoporphyrinogen oxidase
VSSYPVVIVGGGISGLAAAYYLERNGVRPLLLEKARRTGGLIRTDYAHGCLLEAGPDSFLAAKPAVSELAGELGSLQNEIIASNDALRRVFVVRSGKLITLPHGMSMMVPGKLGPALRSPLFGLGTKLRMLSEQSRRPQKRLADISVGEFVADHFGNEMLEYLADPLLAGVYGGSAARLSAQSVLPRFIEYEQRYGSLIRGVQREQSRSPQGGGLFRSFSGGMQMLPDALEGTLSTPTRVLNSEVITVERRQAGRWRVRTGNETITTEQLVLACPAHACAQLLEAAAPELAAELAAVPYSSAILVTVLYDAGHIQHPLDGFGFLVPQPERRVLAAATWVNRKFPSRLAAGLVAIRGFLVGAEALEFRYVTDQEIVQLVEGDLARLMNIASKPLYTHVQRWPDSMPQYVVGHSARQQRIASVCAEFPGLQLIGNAYEGVGIPDCVRLAKAAAQRIVHIKTA